MTSSPLGNRVTPCRRGSSRNRYHIYIYIGIIGMCSCGVYYIFLVFSLLDRSETILRFHLHRYTCLISNYLFFFFFTHFFPSIIIILPSLLYGRGRHVVVVVFCLQSDRETDEISNISPFL